MRKMLLQGFLGAGIRRPLFDAVSSGVLSGGTTSTHAHTCSGTNRALFVSVAHSPVQEDLSGVTYAGVAMVLIDSIVNPTGGLLKFWKLSNPASGSNNIVVTFTGGGEGGTIGAVSFTDANQVTANLTGTPAKGSSFINPPGPGTASVNVSSSPAETVIDAMMFGNDPANANPQVGAGQTERYNLYTVVGASVGVAGSTEDGASSVTMSWGLSAPSFQVGWCIIGVGVKSP